MPPILHSTHVGTLEEKQKNRMDPLTRNQFLNAAFTGELNQLKSLAEKFDDGRRTVVSMTTDLLGRGALHLSAAEGKLNVCKYLVDELKLDVDVKDRKGLTPLAHAALGGNLSTVEYLIEKGANPDTSNDLNITPLHYAAEKGYKDIASLLLSRGVRVDALNDSGTPLQFAAAHGKPDTVKLLLDHHANPNLLFHHIFTPLVAAVVANSLECVKLLIQAGADLDAGSFGVTPLTVAASDGLTEIIKCLVQAGANPDLTNKYGLKPVEIAAINGSHCDVSILLPVTSPVPTCVEWSIGGIMSHVQSEEAKEKRMLVEKEKFHEAKAKGKAAFQEKDYLLAIYWYTEAMEIDSGDATLLSNRSLCWARKKEGDRALGDAKECIFMRPDWPKAYYRAGVAYTILKEYDQAVDAFSKGMSLDPENEELREEYLDALARKMYFDELKAKTRATLGL